MVTEFFFTGFSGYPNPTPPSRVSRVRWNGETTPKRNPFSFSSFSSSSSFFFWFPVLLDFYRVEPIFMRFFFLPYWETGFGRFSPTAWLLGFSLPSFCRVRVAGPFVPGNLMEPLPYNSVKKNSKTR